MSSLHPLNSVMKFIIVLLNSVSWFHLCNSHLTNIFTELLDFTGKIIAFLFQIVYIFIIRFVHVVSFISSMSDIDRVDCGRRKDVQAEFGLDVGYGLGGMRPIHCILG